MTTRAHLFLSTPAQVSGRPVSIHPRAWTSAVRATRVHSGMRLESPKSRVDRFPQQILGKIQICWVTRPCPFEFLRCPFWALVTGPACEDVRRCGVQNYSVKCYLCQSRRCVRVATRRSHRPAHLSYSVVHSGSSCGTGLRGRAALRRRKL